MIIHNSQAKAKYKRITRHLSLVTVYLSLPKSRLKGLIHRRRWSKQMTLPGCDLALRFTDTKVLLISSGCLKSRRSFVTTAIERVIIG